MITIEKSQYLCEIAIYFHMHYGVDGGTDTEYIGLYNIYEKIYQQVLEDNEDKSFLQSCYDLIENKDKMKEILRDNDDIMEFI